MQGRSAVRALFRAVRALAVQANVVAFTHHEGKVLWSEEATSWA